MPIVNITLRQKIVPEQKILKELRKILAKYLSCKESKTKADSFTIRFIDVRGEQKENIEIIIYAHAYKERIKKIDSIPISIKQVLEKKIPEIKNKVKVFVFLGYIGFS